MPALDCRWRILSIDFQTADGAFAEIKPFRRNGAVVRPLHKSQYLVTRDGFRLRRQSEAELVANILQLLRALPRQIARNTFRRLGESESTRSKDEQTSHDDIA